jgi:aspartokinase
VVYFERTMVESLGSRVAANAVAIATLERETDRLRERVHKLESTARGVEHLAKDVEALHASLPTLARQAANEAVTEYLKRQHAERFSNWRTYAALLSAGAALGALVLALILGLG